MTGAERGRGRKRGAPAAPAAPVAAAPPEPGVSPPATLREEPVGDSAMPRLELRAWGERYGVVAGLTARGRGFSLGLWSDENVGQVMTRWRAFRAALGSRFPTHVLSHQVHGNRVEWQRQPPAGWLILDGVDGHATGTPGVLLTVTVADCIPLYLSVPRKRVVALLHAGWRGAAAGILAHGLELLRAAGFARASDVVMHCGVGICGSCYEVGSEVVTALGEPPQAAPRTVDLRGVLVRQARALGVEEISVSPWCTAHDRAQFFSHRASGGRDGRMVAYLGMPLA